MTENALYSGKNFFQMWTLSMLSKNKKKKHHQTIFWNFLFSDKKNNKRNCHFMQIVSKVDNLHEISNNIFRKNKKKKSFIRRLQNLPIMW